MTANASDPSTMKPGERIAYQPIVDRPKLSLPDGKRIIAWPVVNVEEWDVTKEMPRTMLGPPGGNHRGHDVAHEPDLALGQRRTIEHLGEHGEALEVGQLEGVGRVHAEDSRHARRIAGVDRPDPGVGDR